MIQLAWGFAWFLRVVNFFKMPRPYSEDLRWRMIYQRVFYGRGYEEIASQLFVSPRTVYRTLSTFLNTGDVKPCRLGRPRDSITLLPHEEYIIMDCILESPQIQLNEIANHIVQTTGSAFGPKTLCRAIHRLGITRKKIQKIAAQRNEDLRLQFRAEISAFSPEQLVFLDETGIDKRITRQFGYSVRGTRPVVRDLSYSRWAPHFSVVSAISSEGLVANCLLKNPDEKFDARSFMTFLDQQLLPAMNPFNGENPRSVLQGVSKKLQTL